LRRRYVLIPYAGRQNLSYVSANHLLLVDASDIE
jgi:hypothetical protein